MLYPIAWIEKRKAVYDLKSCEVLLQMKAENSWKLEEYIAKTNNPANTFRKGAIRPKIPSCSSRQEKIQREIQWARRKKEKKHFLYCVCAQSQCAAFPTTHEHTFNIQSWTQQQLQQLICKIKVIFLKFLQSSVFFYLLVCLLSRTTVYFLLHCYIFCLLLCSNITHQFNFFFKFRGFNNRIELMKRNGYTASEEVQTNLWELRWTEMDAGWWFAFFLSATQVLQHLARSPFHLIHCSVACHTLLVHQKSSEQVLTERTVGNCGGLLDWEPEHIWGAVQLFTLSTRSVPIQM